MVKRWNYFKIDGPLNVISNSNVQWFAGIRKLERDMTVDNVDKWLRRKFIQRYKVTKDTDHWVDYMEATEQ